jgi:hypothetical protein
LPNDAAKQVAINTYVNHLSMEYPQLAATVIADLTSDLQPSMAIQQIAQGWLRTDPVAAEQWLNSTALPKEQIRQILGKGKE